MSMSLLLPVMLQATAAPVFQSAPTPAASTSGVPGAEQGSEYQTAETTEIELGNQKVICRRRPVTGSFVRTTKECHTRAEWARLDEDVRKQAGEYVDHGRGGTSGN